MDEPHERRSNCRPNLRQVLRVLNEELLVQATSGQLASDLQELHEMESQMKHAISKIHSSINMFPKINQLPPEVLASFPYFLDSHKDLINSTHVCRRWRNVITASPPLWSRLDNETMHKDLVALYIDRCGGTPLDVTLSSKTGEKNQPFLEGVVLHSSHIRRIRFPPLPWWDIAEYSNAFDMPMPLLREVELDASYCDADSPPFERPFLAGATNLVSLNFHDGDRLSGTLLHFIFPSLTHLTLTLDDPRVLLIGELLELLRNSPLVEVLCVHAEVVRDTFDENTTFPDHFQTVDLPHLHNINLNWATPRPQYTLLAHINYPSTCSVTMQLRSQADGAQPPQNVFPKSWDAFSSLNPSSVTLRMKRDPGSTECVVTVKEHNGASILISHRENVEEFISSDDGGNVIIEQNRDRDDNHVLSDAVSFIGKLPLHRVQKFVLEDLTSDHMSTQESFGIPSGLADLICLEMQNLTALSLTRTCITELLHLLSPPPPPSHLYLADLFEPGIPSGPCLPCPSLKTLEIRHPVWVAPRHCPQVIVLAKARKRESIPFERVFLCSPVIPKNMLAGVSPYVGDVDIQKCDGCE